MCKEIYVKEMPKDCWDCPCQDNESGRCKILNRYVDYIPKDCPLKSLHDHDKELVEKVLDKVKRKVDYISMHTITKERLMIMCEEIQQEFEDE